MSHGKKLLSTRRHSTGLPDRRERLSVEYGAPQAEFPRPEELTVEPQAKEPRDSLGAEAEVTAIAVVLLRWRSGLNGKDFAARSRMSRRRLAAYEKARRRAKNQTLEGLLADAGLRPSRLGRLLAASREAREALVPEKPLPVRGEVEALAQGFVGRLADLATAAFRQLFEGVLAVDRGSPWDEAAVPREADRLRAPALWARLEPCSAADRRFLVEENEAYWDWGLCELVTGKSLDAAADDAAESLELAELALLIAELAPGEEPWRWRLEGWARRHLANALRIGNDLRRAEEESIQARQLWQDGAPGDPGLLNEARMLGLEASLRRAQRRLEEARRLLDEALKIDRWGETPYLLLNKALVLHVLGDFDASLAALQAAGPRLHQCKEPRLLFALHFDTAANLCLLERYEEADPLLLTVRALAEKLENERDLLRVRWIEGRVHAGFGREAEALAAFEEARQAFATRSLPYDLALVDLDLALLHLERERTAEVQELAAEMLRIFTAQGVHRETLAALRLFHDAAASGAATAELARELIRYLHRARHDPELRFEG